MSEKPLDAIFEKFLSGPRIFKDREVLRPTYVPDNLPHRDKEINRVGLILATALKSGTPSNVFIYGKTGCGKTAVVRYVLKHLAEKCRELGVSTPSSVYLNCSTVNTNYRVLAHLCENLGVSVPFTGLPTDEVYTRFISTLDSEVRLMIIVLDEVDKLVDKDGDGVLYDLTRINHSVLKVARVSIIGISNNLKFKENLDPRVLSSLGEEELVFPPYVALELQDILRERANMGFLDGALEEPGVINLCAALAAREHGDARRALDLLRVAGEQAERLGVEKVNQEHVRLAQNILETDRVSEVISTLPIQSKLVLYSIYLLENNRSSKITTGSVYNVYSDLCKIVNLEVLGQRRVSGLIAELDMLGIIVAKLKSEGRYGMTKKIKLNVPAKQVKDILENDYHIKKTVKYVPLAHKVELDI
ncbi:MAG: ORC1-type DNA replication protein [Candidatus Jordarchaeum sp.]|uniref:ORC1-type DNA replication protein n=1 Tax=Candidatus Jordarchaeum sp. TaxID=2823881 RepID=UPI00404A6FA1